MLLVQLSDLHILRPGKTLSGLVATDRLLAQCLSAVLALDPAPDAVLLTGDLVDSGSAEEYRHLRALLAPLKMPVFVIPGNHDERVALRAAFADHRYLPQSGALDWVSEELPVRLIGLDSSVPGKPGGFLSVATLAWLDQTLAAAPAQPTIVALHHPPFNTGIGHMDRIGLENPAALAAVIRRHPQVERVLSGHLHRAIQTRFAGTLASTCPSSAHQVECNLQPGHSGGFILEPPGFQLHCWSPADGLVTHLIPVGDFAGPYGFHEQPVALGR
jgi:3',5'-cyclic AMP phosphodiesterase CpdA